MTAATQPSIEDIVLGAMPWIPKVNLHNPFLAEANGDDFLKLRPRFKLTDAPFTLCAGLPSGLLEPYNKTGTQAGVGLSGMRERVNELGGRLEICCEGQGTIVSITIPVTDRCAIRRYCPAYSFRCIDLVREKSHLRVAALS